MKNSAQEVALSVQTQDAAITGCLTFGGVTFIMAALILLSQNDAAHALTMIVNG